MALLAAEAAKLSRDDLVRGVIEEIIDRDELYALIPFSYTEGKAYVYNRENTISEGDFLNPNDTVNEAAATFTTITTHLKIIAGDVDVDKFLLTTQSDTNDQLATQLALKAKGVSRNFRRALIQGDSSVTPASFDGIAKLVTSPMTFYTDGAGAAGAAVTLNLLDQLAYQILHGADALVMRSGTWRAVRSLMRASGGTNPEMIQLPNFGKPVPAYNGIPVILNDFLPTNEVVGSSSVTCSVYAVRLNEVDGLHGIYGGPSAGLQVEEIGTVQNKDAIRHRIKWYVGLALKSTQSLARMAGVTNI